MFRRKDKLIKPAVISLIFLVLISFIACSGKEKQEQASNKEEKIVKIGAILPLTGGRLSLIGEWHKNGMDLYEDNTKKFKIHYIDSEGKPHMAISGLNQVKNKVDVVVGTLSNVMIPVIKSVTLNKPIFLVSVSAPGITNIAENVFRYNINVVDEAKLLLSEIKKNRIDKLGILYINDEYGNTAYGFFEKNAKESGIEVIFSESYERSSIDFKDKSAKISSLKFPLVIFGYGNAYISLLKAIAEVNFQQTIYTDYSMFIKEFTKPLEGCGLKVTYISPAVKNDIYEKWSKEYLKKFGEEPNYAACVSFDIIKLVTTTMTELEYFSKAKLASFLNDKDIYSVYGYKIKADEKGEILIPLSLVSRTL